jgi:sec-independent protein translocase protein TatB
MFDVGFLEMLVIGVIALLVIGPERLPAVAQTIGKFVGKAKAFVSTTKADIEREFQAEEMKKMLSQQNEEINSLREMMQDTQQTIHNQVQGSMDGVSEDLNTSLSDFIDEDLLEEDPQDKKTAQAKHTPKSLTSDKNND